MASSSESDADVLSDRSDGHPAEDDQYDASQDGAPRYPIPSRDLAAVEVPAVVENIDLAVKAFGRVSSLTHVSLHNRLSSVLETNSPYSRRWTP